MIGHLYKIPIAALTVGAVTRTLIQVVTPATRRAWLLGFSLSGKSVNATDVPVLVDFVRQTSAGTTGATTTPRPLNPDHPASLLTINSGYTVEPSDGGVIAGGPYYVSPVGGLYTEQFPEGWEIQIPVSSRLGMRVVCPQSTDLAGHAWILE